MWTKLYRCRKALRLDSRGQWSPLNVDSRRASSEASVAICSNSCSLKQQMKETTRAHTVWRLHDCLVAFPLDPLQLYSIPRPGAVMFDKRASRSPRCTQTLFCLTSLKSFAVKLQRDEICVYTCLRQRTDWTAKAAHCRWAGFSESWGLWVPVESSRNTPTMLWQAKASYWICQHSCSTLQQ